jgi:hypothetical protein
MFLSAGVDNPQLLQMAARLGNNPRAMRDQMKGMVTRLKQAASSSASDGDNGDDDEQLPPTSS